MGYIQAAAMFGSETYSKEELVAELGSAIILNQLGIETPLPIFRIGYRF